MLMTCCGEDKLHIRIWSLASGSLIRLFDFGDLCSKVSSKQFTEDFLLDDDQVAAIPAVPEWARPLNPLSKFVKHRRLVKRSPRRLTRGLQQIR